VGLVLADILEDNLTLSFCDVAQGGLITEEAFLEAMKRIRTITDRNRDDNDRGRILTKSQTEGTQWEVMRVSPHISVRRLKNVLAQKTNIPLKSAKLLVNGRPVCPELRNDEISSGGGDYTDRLQLARDHVKIVEGHENVELDKVEVVPEDNNRAAALFAWNQTGQQHSLATSTIREILEFFSPRE
jgi:hypothetical protein